MDANQLYKSAIKDYNRILLIRKYSQSTVNTYRHFFIRYLRHFYPIDLALISKNQIRDYLISLSEKHGYSNSSINQAINAIKFYYEKVMGEEKEVYHLERPLKEKTLPIVLSQGEMEKIISHLQNTKHRAIIVLIYSSGLRIGELINMKLEDKEHRIPCPS